MIRTSMISAAALALALAGPAFAQTAGQGGATPGAAPTMTQGAAGMGMGGADLSQLQDRLGEAEIENARDFPARLFRARTEQGDTVFMLIGPRDLQAEDAVDVDESDLRERLQGAGFTDLQPVENAEFLHGELGDDAMVIVLRANDFEDPMATGAVGGQGGMGAGGGMTGGATGGMGAGGAAPLPPAGGGMAPGAAPGAPGAAPGAPGAPGAAPGGTNQ